MAEKLEPCLFCGGDDIHVYIMTTASRAYAVCDMCDAEGPLAWSTCPNPIGEGDIARVPLWRIVQRAAAEGGSRDDA